MYNRLERRAGFLSSYLRYVLVSSGHITQLDKYDIPCARHLLNTFEGSLEVYKYAPNGSKSEPQRLSG